jgi:DNA-binding protein HU-beta
MEHSEIVQLLADRLQVTPKESRRLIQALVKLFTEKLGGNDKFSIPGFGTFGTRIRKERKAYNPGTKTVQLIPKKNLVYFRPASQLKQDMKNKEVK